MKIINRTKGTVLAEDAGIARTFAEKSIGLLGRTMPASLYFKTRFGIHTAGMQFSIDCAALDERLTVRAVRRNLVPGRFFFWNPRYRHVIELPAGTLAHTGTEVGDSLAFN